jgi:hypothetical protein
LSILPSVWSFLSPVSLPAVSLIAPLTLSVRVLPHALSAQRERHGKSPGQHSKLQGNPAQKDEDQSSCFGGIFSTLLEITTNHPRPSIANQDCNARRRSALTVGLWLGAGASVSWTRSWPRQRHAPPGMPPRPGSVAVRRVQLAGMRSCMNGVTASFCKKERLPWARIPHRMDTSHLQSMVGVHEGLSGVQAMLRRSLGKTHRR